jgi:hypothetical protein
MSEYNRLPNKYINIYDIEANPVEKCENIKKEWGYSCNFALKNKNTDLLSSQERKKCINLFNDYIDCYIKFNILKNS